MKNIVGYIRVSTNNQDLERQKELIKDYADLYDCSVVEFICESITGTTAEREGYKKLLSLTNDYADTVVMTEVSRFSRESDVMNPIIQVNDIIHNGLTVVFMDNDPHITQTYKEILNPEQITKLANDFAASAAERNKIVGRMISGKKSKFMQFPNGLWGKAPFGYRRVVNPDYKMTHNPRSFKERDENAEIVAQMYQWIIDGSSLKDVALRLQARGIKTAPSTKYPEGNDFDANIVASVIHNPIYKGEWTLDNKTIHWDGIVSEEIWEQAQLALKNNRVRTIIRDVNFNPLKGIMKCPCGKSMYIVNDRKYVRYRCAIKKNKYDSQVCSNGSTGYDITLKCVWNAVLCSARDIQFANETTKEIDRLLNKVKAINEDIKSRKKLIAKNEETLESIAENLFKFSSAMIEKISLKSAEIEKLNNQYSSEIDALREKRRSLIQRVSDLKAKNVIDENFTIEQKAEIFQQLLSSVTYYDVAMHRGFLEVVFKNGLRYIYLVLAAQKKIYQLPLSFNFIKETKEVEVQMIKDFSLKRYTFNEILDKFELESI